MFGSAFLEVAIGISFIYMLLSLVCTTLNEMISQVLSMRAKTLEVGLHRILADQRLRSAFYAHPLVRSLGQPKSPSEPVRPSYIPPQTFSMVMMDVIADQVQGGPSGGKKDAFAPPFEQWRSMVGQLEQEDIKRVMLNFIDDADFKVDKVRRHLETWFDNVMDRVSGTYKRQTQRILMIISVLLCFAVNADTFEIVRTLWESPALRQGVVAAAETYTQKHDPTSGEKASLQELRGELSALNIPLGWHVNQLQKDLNWFSKIIGLLFTALAVSLGAPFWFDLLNRFVRLRSSIKPPSRRTETT